MWFRVQKIAPGNSFAAVDVKRGPAFDNHPEKTLLPRA